MKLITLTKIEIEWCKGLALKRSGSVNHADTINSRNFIKNKPPWHRHYIGVIGEFAYSKHIGLPVDHKTIGKGDTGTDFCNGIDIKSSDYKKKPNLLLPVGQFQRKTAKQYVLAWVRLPNVYLIGQIDSTKVISLSRVKNFGYGDTYFIRNEDLDPII